MAKKNKVMAATQKQVEEAFGWAQTERIMGLADKIFAGLCADNADQP